jgi:hypothetical protein
MKQLPNLPRPSKRSFNGELLLGLLLVSAFGQIGACFSTGRVILAPTAHLLRFDEEQVVKTPSAPAPAPHHTSCVSFACFSPTAHCE